MPWGEKHGKWKGDAASDHTKRQRARRLFKAGPCERCGSTGRTERHHIDGDPGNNVRGNILIVCRRCHQLVDGRLEASVRRLVALARERVTPPRPCSNCGRDYKPLRNGRCGSCAIHWRKHGVELDTANLRKRELSGSELWDSEAA